MITATRTATHTQISALTDVASDESNLNHSGLDYGSGPGTIFFSFVHSFVHLLTIADCFYLGK